MLEPLCDEDCSSRVVTADAPARAALFAAALLLSLSGCTTYVEPATCTPGSTACGGISDARFCESVAVAVEGADCASLHIAEAKPFCVVKAGPCVSTHYVLEGRDCTVLEYESLRDLASAECPPGTPMFTAR